MTGLRFGQPAPDFTLPSTSGADITLSALRGQDVVLVFYCFDWGSIWTPELLGLVKVDPEIRQRGATILPISADSPFSHAAYAKAQGFPFPLLSDIHRTVIRAYGVLDEARNVAWRSTFVVDRDGMLRWGQVGDRQMVRDGTEILRVLDLLVQLRATWGRVRDQRKCRRSVGVGPILYVSFRSLHKCTSVHNVKLNCSTSAPGRRLLPVERSW
jgi:mycoredoxin-dependent peroxiredoxin